MDSSVDMRNNYQDDVFKNHVFGHAKHYFPEFEHEAVDVKLIGCQERDASILYRLRIDFENDHRYVLVKMPLWRSDEKNTIIVKNGANVERPRLVPLTETGVKFQFESAALSEIHRYFSKLNDPRFGAIRVLDELPEQRAVIMEEVRCPNLRQLFMNSSRLYPRRHVLPLEPIFHNVGGWLRAYHALPKRDYVESRHTQRDQFIESIVQFTDYFTRALGGEPFWQMVASKSMTSALHILPTVLPAGLGHGDYAMRNILIAPNEQVIVLDTLAKWQTAIYEDIAYFLVRLKINWPQIFSFGLAFNSKQLIKYEQEFLAGYFGAEPVPFKAIQIYKIQALLDYWSSIVARARNKPDDKRVKFGSLRENHTNRVFRSNLSELLRSVEVAADNKETEL